MTWGEFKEIVEKNIDHTHEHLAWIDVDFPDPEFLDKAENFEIRVIRYKNNCVSISKG